MNEGRLIQDSAARLFSDAANGRLNEEIETGGFPNALWAEVEAVGFQLALAPEPHGVGLSVHQVLPIFAELARHRIPLPLAETAIACALLASADVIPPQGPATLIDRGPGTDLVLEQSGGVRRLSGRAAAVPWARHARWALISLPHDGLVWTVLDRTAGVQIEHGTDIAGLPSDRMTFVKLPVLGRLPAQIFGIYDPLRTLGALLHATMMVGAAEWILSQAIAYANDRVQFGRPIGKNQALQQLLADAAGNVASARMAAFVAGLDLCAKEPSRAARAEFGVAVAKVRAGEAATRISAVAHQVFGAIGFTREHGLHFATRRLWAWRSAYGSDGWWAERLGQAAIRDGASEFWPAMTRRHFAFDQPRSPSNPDISLNAVASNGNAHQ